MSVCLCWKATGLAFGAARADNYAGLLGTAAQESLSQYDRCATDTHTDTHTHTHIHTHTHQSLIALTGRLFVCFVLSSRQGDGGARSLPRER